MLKIDRQNDPYWFRPVLIFWFTVTIFISTSIMGIIALFIETNYGIFALLIVVITGISLVFIKLRKYTSSFSLLLISLSIVVFFQGYWARSAYVLTFLALMIIISGMLCNLRFTTFLFVAVFCIVVIYCELGILSWTQQYDTITGVPLVNNITVIFPLLFIAYIIALIVSKVIFGTIDTQQKQYEILQKTQNKLITQEKLESISILAGGIAHDFNNLLTAILGNIELIINDETVPKTAQECAKDAQKASLQARDLTGQLLNYSKGDSSSQIKPENGKTILEEVAKFALRGRKSKVQLVIPNDLWPVLVDRNQIAQVVQNLLLNADNAMPDGGFIEIVAVNYQVSGSIENQIDETSNVKKNTPLKTGNYVLISITDHGRGISRADQSKIFVPFYTTKPNGMGLGLTISKTIIEKHHGHIEFESTPNRGTTFRIYLPANIKESSFISMQNDFKPNLINYNKTALIYDDQENVIKTMKAIMQKLGVQLESASNSAECIEKLDEEHFDMVILDLTIPGDIGGKELAPKIKQLYPHIKTIASSGYSQDILMNNYQAFGLDQVLRKPYTIEEVSILLQQLFNSQKMK